MVGGANKMRRSSAPTDDDRFNPPNRSPRRPPGGLQTARSEGPSELVSIGVEDCPPSGGYRASIGSHIWDLCPCDCGWVINKLK